jgi:hypothetical protein
MKSIQIAAIDEKTIEPIVQYDFPRFAINE